MVSLKINRRKARQIGVIALGIVLVAVILAINGTDGLSMLSRIEPGFIAAAVAAQLALTWVTTLRWRWMTRAAGDKLAGSFWLYYCLLMVTRATGLVAPQTISDVTSRVVLQSTVAGVNPQRSLAVVFTERVLDLAAPVLIVGVAAMALLAWIPLGDAAVVCLGGGLTLLAIFCVGPFLKLASKRILILGSRPQNPAASSKGGSQKLAKWVLKPLEIAWGFAELSRKDRLLLGAMTLGRMFINAGVLYAVALSLPITHVPSYWTIFLVSAIVQSSAVVAFTPGGLGVLDAVMSFALAQTGLSGAEAIAIVAAQRLVLYGFFLVSGAASYYALMVFARQSRPSPAPAAEQSPSRV